MALFNRKSTNSTAIPEDLQPYYTAEQPAWRRWLAWFLRILALLAVIALIIWGLVWAFNKFTGGGEDTPPTQTEASDAAEDRADEVRRDAAAAAKAAEQKVKAEAAQAAEEARKKAASGTVGGSTQTNPGTAAPAPTPTAPSPTVLPKTGG